MENYNHKIFHFSVFFIVELMGYSPTYKKNSEYIFKNQKHKNKNLRNSFIIILGESVIN